MWTYKNSKIRVNPDTRKIFFDRIIAPRQSGFLCLNEANDEVTAEMVLAEYDRQNPPELIQTEEDLQLLAELPKSAKPQALKLIIQGKKPQPHKISPNTPQIAPKQPFPKLNIPHHAIIAFGTTVSPTHDTTVPTNLQTPNNYAAKNKVSRRTVYRMIENGTLVSTKIDGVLFIDTSKK